MKNQSRRSAILRQLKASLRDSWLMLREFAWPLAMFVGTITGGGLLYNKLSHLAGEPPNSLLESIYQVLSLTFLQSIGDFPRAWYLDIFFFAMPLVGIGILSLGLAEFGAMFFNRKQRGKEWEMAVASTFQQHHILVGLGHLGYRVVRSLLDMGQEVVVIEMKPSHELVSTVKKLGVPVIQEDASRLAILESAGIQRAKTIILCTQNDSLNLQVALKARQQNKNIHVVVRIFDDEFAQALQEQFGFTAFSATQIAAPIFAASAARIDMTKPITIENQQFSLAKLQLSQSSQLVGLSVAKVEERFNVSVVLIRRQDSSDLHPNAQVILRTGDILAILGGPGELTRILEENL